MHSLLSSLRDSGLIAKALPTSRPSKAALRSSLPRGHLQSESVLGRKSLRQLHLPLQDQASGRERGGTRETCLNYREKGLNHDPKALGIGRSRFKSPLFYSFIHSFVHLFTKHSPTTKTVVHTEDIQAVESLPAPMEVAFQLCDLKKIT